MPYFENVYIETKIDVEFEVYCGTCGNGLCGESDTRRRNSRGPAVTVNACPYCMSQKDDEIEELSLKIEELEEKLNSI